MTRDFEDVILYNLAFCEYNKPVKKIVTLILIIVMPIWLSGCALIGTALSVAAAYGLYKAFEK
ncbi:MAG: hypothetical protein V2A72_04560 [Candidatus Omnitrophota bacterium]